jgi:GNAT superfamily N-acetyltransferase
MKIEPLTKQDLDQLAPLQPQGWPDIKPGLQFYLANPFCHAVKISKHDRMMGIGAGIVFGKTAWLAHIIVDPEFRGKGLAHKIVAHLLEKLTALQCESVSLIATDMGYPIYEKAGFKKQTDYVFFKKEVPLAPYPDSPHIIAFSPDYQKAVFKLDQSVSGEDRRLIFAGKFESACLYRENNQVTGIYLPNLGEGMIIAENSRAGTALLRKKYAGIDDKAVLPVDNAAGIEFLMENDFTETLRAARMIWGKPFVWQPDKIYSRIAGKLG